MSNVSENTPSGISNPLVKNLSELTEEVATQLNLSSFDVSTVVREYSNECVRLVSRGDSFFLSDLYFAKVTETGYPSYVPKRVVPFGSIVRTSSNRTGVPYFTSRNIIERLIKLCVFYADKGYSARMAGLVTFKKSPDGRIKLSYGTGVKNSKEGKDLRVSFKDMTALLSA